MNITEFLLARIAEDEAVAQAAPGPKWLVGYEREGAPGRWTGIAAYLAALPPSDRTSIIEIGDEVARSVGNDSRTMDHITRHDPDRVLAECKAKRAIVEIHGDDGRGDCTVCGSEIGYTFDYETNDETYNPDRHPAEFPCSTMRALASMYSDHTDYDDAWRVA